MEKKRSAAKTELLYKELECLSQRLGIPVVSSHIKVEATKDGRVTDRFAGRCHTWNRNYWNWLLAETANLPFVVTNFGAGYISAKRNTGAVTAIASGNGGHFVTAGVVSNSNYGIVTGTGAGAEDFEGYELTTPIIHGVAAGNLSHRAQVATTQAYTAGTKTWEATLTRLFDNLSGGSIIVAETGIKSYQAGGVYYYLICRDLLGAPVTVLDDGILTVEYKMSLVFPG